MVTQNSHSIISFCGGSCGSGGGGVCVSSCANPCVSTVTCMPQHMCGEEDVRYLSLASTLFETGSLLYYCICQAN